MSNRGSVWPHVCQTTGRVFDLYDSAERIHHYESDGVIAANIVQGGLEQYLRVCHADAKGDDGGKARREAINRFNGYRQRVANDPELARASGLSTQRVQEITQLAEASRGKRSAWGNRPKAKKLPAPDAPGPEVIRQR